MSENETNDPAPTCCAPNACGTCPFPDLSQLQQMLESLPKKEDESESESESEYDEDSDSTSSAVGRDKLLDAVRELLESHRYLCKAFARLVEND